MPTDQTIDFVVIFLITGLVVLWGGSVTLGMIARMWDRFVNRSQVTSAVMSPENAQTVRTDQTDERTDQVSEADRWLDRLEVDRTKTTLIELLVYSGWEVAQIRGVLKGENAALGTEIEAAKIRLGIADAPRMLHVRDDKGERDIVMT